MKSRFLRGLAVCVALFGFILHRGDSLRALSSDLVISQVYGGGGNAGATYRNDFIEIFNRGTSSVSLSGKSVQYASAAGTTWAVTSLTSVTLAPGQYYLVQEAVGAGGTTNLPAPDASGGIAMSATAGKVALVTGTAALTGTCPTTGVIDFVGFGGANCFESAPTPVLTNTTAALRGNAGCTETDNNAGDFAIGAPTPRNTASSLAPCGGGDTAPSVTGTSPGNSATNTPVNSNVIITFSESVTATASAFSIQCPAGVPQGFTQSASPSGSITLDPTSNLPAGTTCTVTVTATQITDTDTADPPDQMAANFGFSFTTANPVDAAPSVIGTTPADGAPNVAVTSPIVINFSESVTASPTAFAVQCPAGTPQSFGQSASPAVAFTLTPASPLPYSTTCTVTVTADQIVDADANDPPDGMTSNRALSFTTAAAPPPGAGIVRINEVDADTPGTDTAEFIELYDGGVGNTSLKGLVVVFFDGTGTNSNGTPNTNGKQSYVAFDLDDYSTDAQGYFVMGNPGVAGATLTFLPGEFGLLQNGPDAVGLYIGNASDFPNGTLATTTNLQDAIVYGTDDPAAAGLEPLLNAGLIVNENATGNSQTQASQRCPNGMGGFRNTSNYYPGTPTPGADNTCPAPRLPSDVVISQIYGGGGNSGATYRNDFVELFNRGAGTVDLTGWSLQYASSTGSGWGSNLQPLGGTLGAGKYYLVALGSGGAVGASLPPANISGLINMAGGSGKIALVSSFEPLIGGCPLYDPTIKDFVGYGSGADCGEGSTTTASGSNTAALYRKSNGSIDTDNNAGDFNSPASLPIPRQTEPIIELGPLVLSRDPRVNGFNAPRDATIQVIFTEPVTVDGAWFRLTCASSGQHNSATFASSFGGQDQFITPNDNFIAGEQCTMTIVKDRVHDVDSDDFATNTDTLPADVSWSFTVASGAAPAYPASVHLTLGNPGNAGSDPANYLMEKPEFAVSYNRDLGRPNWVSWHLSDEWVGTLARVDTFRPDPQIPPDWYRVQSFDFSGSGFDRGHMTPNADRDKETSVPINQATFLMSNMVAQAPANNQGPWAALEGYLRTLADPLNVTEPGNNELYIVSGPAGAGGSGSANTEQNPVITTIADGHVTVPAWTWKVALVLPKGDDDMSRVTCSTRTIAVILPNTQAVNTDWKTYLKTVDEVEALSGYDLFSNLPVPFQNCIEARKDGTPALTLVKGDQMITFAAPSNPTYGDAPFAVSATGGLSGNPVTFAASGACTSGGFNGATITVNSAGTCTITASQAASAAYNAATDAIQTVTVSKAGPSFSNLTTVTIEAGTATTALGGIVSFGALVPTGSVTITLNGVTQTAAVGPGGAFSASFATALLAPSATPYLVGYAYSGDTNFTPAAGTGSVRVVDTVAPSIGSVSVSRSLLSPPNHKMIDITIGYQAADVTAAPVCSLSISTNESIDGLGDGNTSIDWQVIDPHHVQLRSERSGGGNGRLYTITIRCTDSSGNTGSATTTVTVPK